MKLGTQTGSVINHLKSRSVIGEPVPVVGLGVTLLGWTDRDAATICSVETLISKVYSLVIGVQRDHSKVISGSAHDGSAAYEYTPQPQSSVSLFAKRCDTKLWEAVSRNKQGRLVKDGTKGIRIGERDTYFDPSF